MRFFFFFFNKWQFFLWGMTKLSPNIPKIEQNKLSTCVSSSSFNFSWFSSKTQTNNSISSRDTFYSIQNENVSRSTKHKVKITNKLKVTNFNWPKTYCLWFSLTSNPIVQMRLLKNIIRARGKFPQQQVILASPSRNGDALLAITLQSWIMINDSCSWTLVVEIYGLLELSWESYHYLRSTNDCFLIKNHVVDYQLRLPDWACILPWAI